MYSRQFLIFHTPQGGTEKSDSLSGLSASHCLRQRFIMKQLTFTDKIDQVQQKAGFNKISHLALSYLEIFQVRHHSIDIISLHSE